MRKNFVGFTLAEVLITLGVIGVVAAITLPTMITNLNERINSERQANIAQKVTQAMEQMRAHGLLNTQYASTDAFVDELQKYLKVAKRCDSAHIADCWPTEKITAGDGKEYDVSYLKTGKRLNLTTKTNNVGLVLADGASIILNYNPDAKTLDVGDKVNSTIISLPVGGKPKEFAYTTASTNSIDFIMDVNGAKKPNSETINNKWHDVRSFNIAKIGGCTGTYISGIGCVVILNNYEPETDPEKSSFVKKYCESEGKCEDYWLGAVNACKALGDGYELPDKSTMISICAQRKNYSLPQGLVNFWENATFHDYAAHNISFYHCGEAYAINRSNSSNKTMCVGK